MEKCWYLKTRCFTRETPVVQKHFVMSIWKGMTLLNMLKKKWVLSLAQ